MDRIVSKIDHTLLKAEAKKEEIIKLCKEALEYKFAAVCLNPSYVKLASEVLQGSSIKIATVVGFPLGANTKEVKAFETRNAIENGANEIDMVINIGALKNKDYDLVKDDIRAVVEAAANRALVKVIIETCLLTEEEKIKACELIMESGPAYVKTSTGFSSGGAKLEDIQLIKSLVGDSVKIKASGGIRDLRTARQMIEAGASRLGASASVNIAKEEILD